MSTQTQDIDAVPTIHVTGVDPVAATVPVIATAQTIIPDLSAFLREQMDVLAKATDQAAADTRMQTWLRLMSHRPQYSPRNMLLVLFQDPDATHVGSVKYWATLGRQPVVDATKLWVLAPIGRRASRSVQADDTEAGDATSLDGHRPLDDRDSIRKAQRSTDTRPSFIEVPIYDVRGTSGAALPQIPEWRSLSRRADLDNHLRAFAETKGIEVKVETLQKKAQGISMGGRILLAPNAGTKTLAHELMHELLPHHASWIPSQVREWQAEIGAYLVCARFGVTELNCPTYLAGWTASGKQVRKQFEIAADPARELIQFVEARMGLRPVSEVDDAT